MRNNFPDQFYAPEKMTLKHALNNNINKAWSVPNLLMILFPKNSQYQVWSVSLFPSLCFTQITYLSNISVSFHLWSVLTNDTLKACTKKAPENQRETLTDQMFVWNL